MDKHISSVRAAILAGLIFIFSAAAALAQNAVTVSGTVSDSKGEPVIGAAVMPEGTSTGTLTDAEGKWSLTFTPKAGESARLVVSSLSYITQTVDVTGKATVNVVLQDDYEQLEETVVIGYGSMRKGDITGSVTSVKIDEMKAAQSSSLGQLLQGNAAGVHVVSNSAAPDAAVSVTIRGASSFNSGSQPLYVVDGVIMNTDGGTYLGSHAGDDDGIDEDSNGLMGISPQDIASIEILKDASATAIYGSQGANGVVLISTKQATREKPSVTFSAGVSISNIYKKFDLMDAEDYKKFLDLKGIDHESALYTIYTDRVEDGTYSPVDWQDFTTRTSVTQRYYLTVAGRPKGTGYRFSVGYNDNGGVIRGTGYKNLTMRLNLDKTIGKFRFGTNTSVSWLDSEMTQGVGSSLTQTPATSLVMSMLLTRPLKHKIDYDDDGDEIDDGNAPVSGPDRWLSDYKSKRTEIRVTPSVYAQYQILPWLTFKSSFGMDLRSDERMKFKSNRINTQATGSTGAVGHIDRMNWNWDNLFLFDHKVGKHYISGTLGQSASMSSTKNSMVEGTNISQWKAMEGSLNSAPYNWMTYSESYSQLLSFFARAIYNYGDRYVLTATYRFDGSSKFAGKNKWAQFPSFAFAWRINEEPWFSVPVISAAKLRLGYGMVGNQGVPSYQTIYRYGTNIVPTHDNDTHKQVSISSLNLPSYDLKWETTNQYNVGIDFGMFNGRLSLAADAYYKVTKDLLQTKTLAGSAGVYNPYVNMGSIANRGFELTLSAVPVLTKDFEWTIGGNFSLNRNKILSIDPAGLNKTSMYVYADQPIQEVEYFSGNNLSGDAICRDYINVFIAGYPMCLFYAMPTDGIVQAGQTGVPFSDGKVRGEGSVNFVDTNGDGVITAADRVVVGDPNPDFTYGFNTSFRWRDLSISASFIGSYGNDIYNQQAAVLSDVSTNSANRLRDPVFNSWTPEKPDAKYPSLSAYTPNDVNWCTDRFVEDGSYLRLADLAVSYSLPRKLFRNCFIKHVSFGVSGKNLFVWTKYSGYDPDVNVYGNVLKYGVDIGSYPSARTFMFDLKVSF